MKVRTQNMMQCVEFGNCHIVADGFGVRLCIESPNSRNVALAGNYGSEEIAKGVLQEMIYAFAKGEPVFYMPAE